MLAGFAVGDQVWCDLNANGVQDAADVTAPGAVIELYGSTDETAGNSDDALLSITESNASGQYGFSGLPQEHHYYMIFRAPVGFQFTTADAGDDALDSDVNAYGVTPMFSGVDGESYASLDAGLVGAAPGFGFALGVGGTGVDAATAVQADASGDVFLVGVFNGAADFDFGPGQYALAPAGSQDIFVARYTAVGALRWAQALGGAGAELALSAAVASDGNLLLTGYFSGTADFDPGTAAAELTSAGGADIFVAKLAGNGGLLWVDRAGGAGDDVGRGVDAAADGSVYSTGYYAGTVDFDPDTTISELSLSGSYVWKLDSSGNLLWAKGFAADGAHSGARIAAAADGSVYWAGTCAASIDMDPGAGSAVYTSAGGNDAILGKLSAAGEYIWAQGVSGTGADEADALAVSSDGHVYLGGAFTGAADFDAGTATATLTASGNSADGYVACYNSFGVIQWARAVGGAGVDYVQDLAVAADKSLYATGAFQGTVDFDLGPGAYSRQSAGGADVFLMKFDANGIVNWARTFGGPNDDLAYGVAPAANGGAFLAGQFVGAADFDPSDASYSITSADAAAFLVRLDPPAPTSLALTSDRTLAGQPAGALVGYFWAAEDVINDRLEYALISGAGDADNAQFTVVDRELRTAAPLSAAHGAYHIRVRVVNSVGYYLEQVFTVTPIAPADACSIAGRAWGDLDQDGSRDAGEAGLAGVPVKLVASPDNVPGNYDDYLGGEALSDAQGQFQFQNLLPGLNYFYAVCAPVGYAFSPQQVGGDSNLDSDVNAAGLLPLVSFSTAASHVVRDAGLVGAAPDFGWALHASGAGADRAQAVAVDADGNVFAAGGFQGTVDFDPGPGYYTLTALGGVDAYVAKYTAAGALLWVDRIGGNGNAQGIGLAVAPEGGVYLTGRFAGVVDADPGPAAAALASVGGFDLFTLRLDAAGKLLWAKQTSSSIDDNGAAVTVAPDGSVYTVGTANGGVIVIKQNAAGDFLWSQRVTGSGNASAGAVAADGSLYVVGVFSGAIDFDPGAGVANAASRGEYDAFVCKFDAAGNLLWSQTAGGSSDDYATAVAVKGDGDGVCVAGSFFGAVDFDPGPGEIRLISQLSDDAFLWSLSPAGAAQWAQCFGGYGDDAALGLAIGPDGTLYTAGFFRETVDFDPSPAKAESLVSAGGADAFLAEFDGQGAFRRLRRLGGAGDEGGSALCRGDEDAVYLAGSFTGAADFNPGPGNFSLTSGGGEDLYVVKLRLAAQSTCGVYDPVLSQFHLSAKNDWGSVANPFGFGAPNWMPVAGDWNGDSYDSIGLFDPASNQFYLRNSNNSGGADISFGYGSPNSGQVVVMGDWDGDGTETAGLFAPSTSLFELRNSNDSGIADIAFGFGAPGTDAFFDPKVAVTAGGNPQAIVSGDFNGDGNIDLVVANSATNSVALLLGDGRGVMGAAAAFATGGLGPQALVAADFNRDGVLDLAVTNRTSNTIGVLLAKTKTVHDDVANKDIVMFDGGFNAATTFSSGGIAPYGIVAGDFNGDGKLDLAAANRAAANVAVLVGNGAGGFAAAATFATGGTAPEILVKADFNGDGKLDLATTNVGSNTVAVLLGNGAGRFGAPAAFSSGGTAPKGLAVGDFNRDGKLDLAVGNSTATVGVGILLGNGSGGFAAATMFSSGAANPSALVTGDFNDDGIADLAVLNGGAGVTAMYGALDSKSGPGNLSFPTIKTFSSGGTATWLTAADFSGDGKLDLAVANNDAAGSVGVLLNYRWEPVVGDWDGDGRDTVGLYDPSTGMFYLRNALSTGMAEIAFPYGAAQSGWQPLIGDWNGDGADSAGFFVFNANHFYLRDAFTAGDADHSFAMGVANKGWRPIVGNWAGLAGQALVAAESGQQSAVSSQTPIPDPQSLILLVSDALARWSAAGYTIANPVEIVITDLPGNQLGEAIGNTMYLDRDAAGLGWFVDSTPTLDEEFTRLGAAGPLTAVDMQAVDKIDLLTVIEHELGHIAGLDDLAADAGGLMSAALGVGVRRLPG